MPYRCSREGEWTDGKRTIKGNWYYDRNSERFYISIDLDTHDSLTGERIREFCVSGDYPEWGNWKLIREAKHLEATEEIAVKGEKDETRL